MAKTSPPSSPPRVPRSMAFIVGCAMAGNANSKTAPIRQAPRSPQVNTNDPPQLSLASTNCLSPHVKSPPARRAENALLALAPCGSVAVTMIEYCFGMPGVASVACQTDNAGGSPDYTASANLADRRSAPGRPFPLQPPTPRGQRHPRPRSSPASPCLPAAGPLDLCSFVWLVGNYSNA
jgi:hypothetical protein